MSKKSPVNGTVAASKSDNTGTWTLFALGAVVAGFVWCTRKLNSSSVNKKVDEKPKAATPPAPRTVGKGKKKRKADKEAEKQRRAEKREKHLDQEPGPREKEEDDGNNELFVNYTFHTGGRSDRATDAFGGKAVLKK
eukprot:CAMPEP_0177752236 /NCGR_PEP_ID=MMETSP0491_2-20121128/810_1 /TAXON_ID=63592 /ORGANISM="Tetraselmis chuii, Strain PLY429" /LENGTH=136 /DNA_ID=CAMNT_0019267423 /DNA_START=163 /DNA_END=573 /DNA_ORIENTATION=+